MGLVLKYRFYYYLGTVRPMGQEMIVIEMTLGYSQIDLEMASRPTQIFPFLQGQCQLPTPLEPFLTTVPTETPTPGEQLHLVRNHSHGANGSCLPN